MSKYGKKNRKEQIYLNLITMGVIVTIIFIMVASMIPILTPTRGVSFYLMLAVLVLLGVIFCGLRETFYLHAEYREEAFELADNEKRKVSKVFGKTISFIVGIVAIFLMFLGFKLGNIFYAIILVLAFLFYGYMVTVLSMVVYAIFIEGLTSIIQWCTKIKNKQKK